ncbi:MAG: helix-turn-helix domain-containing protein [Candidatus Merdivicinus sp.]
MFLERLKILRQEKGKTQSEIAEMIGVKKLAYIHYEQGRRKLSADALIILARYYDVTTDYLLGLTEERKPFPKK